MYATLLYMPIYLKSYGYSNTAIGELLFVFSLPMSLVAYVGSYVGRLVGSRRVVVIAFALDLLAVLWYVGLSTYSGLAFVMVGLVVAGLGSGLGTVSMQATALEAVDEQLAGVASGIYSTFRYVGSISASALISLMVVSRGIHWTVMAIAALGGIAVARGLPTLRRSSVQSQTESVSR